MTTMRSHTSNAVVVEFTPSGAHNRPPPPKRLGYDLFGDHFEGGRFCVESDDVYRVRRLLHRAVRITFYPDDQFAKFVAPLGTCPHCGQVMEIGDEDISERICDACVANNPLPWEAHRG
jgi:hypothetical protein